jgi:radical SAM protein with 4Fe4S-binding SPASM domain
MNLAEAALELPLPQFVQIEPVGQCNLACRMCPVAYRGEGNGRGTTGKAPAFMSFDAFTRVLEEFPDIRELHLQGLGEPLLHPRFFDMVRHAAARGIEVTTNTNMTAMSERRAEECVASGLTRMYVSLDAAQREAYEYIRTGARYDRVLRNLRWVVDAKRRLRADAPEIHLVAVVMRRNLEELPGLVRLAHEFGLQGISVQHLAHDFSESSLPEKYRPMREFVDRQTLLEEDPARIAKYFGEALATAGTLGVKLRLPRPQPRPHPEGTSGRTRCDWPWRGSYISYSGEAMPCCMVATPDRINFGNMTREGVVRVWNNEAYRAFREGLASDEPPEICRGCAVYRGTF